MAYKRLMGVIPVKNSTVVKSYGYRSWRPAGDLVTAMRNLDRWNVDEILVLDISRRAEVDRDVIRMIKRAAISTPLTYGGGLRRVDDVLALMDAGCERFVLETLLFDEPQTVMAIAEVVGAQALIGSLPLIGSGDGLRLDPEYAARFHIRPDAIPLQDLCSTLNQLPVAEMLVTAMEREGAAGTFDLVENHAMDEGPLAKLQKGVIWFGGLSPHIGAWLLKRKQTIAIAFANVLVEHELAVHEIRRHFVDESVSPLIRPAGLR